MPTSQSLEDAALVSVALAHELQNALAVVASSLYLARRDRGVPEALSRHLDESAAQLDEAQRVIQAVLRLARGNAVGSDSFELADVVARAARSVALPAGVSLRNDTTAVEGALRGDGVLAIRAVANLLQNAVEALAERGGTVTITHQLDGATAAIIVEDDGPGIDPAVAETLFDARITTKAHGTGVGLAFVRVVMRAHGGTVEAAARPDGRPGARLVLRFPV